MTRLHQYIPIIVLLAAAPSAFSADQSDAAEKRLRETLRSTMLQLRAAETEKAALLASKTELEQTNKALQGRVDGLAKQAEADKDASAKSIEGLTKKGVAQDQEIEKIKHDLAEWKAGFQKAADVARTKEAERAKLAQEGIELRRVVADRETKNLALFRLGNEILVRYENFGLGTALAAREPFVGTARVKLQNLVQGYQDKLSEQRARPSDEHPVAKEPAKQKAGR